MILEKYGKKAFYISKETIIITIPINKELLEKSHLQKDKRNLTPKEEKILKEIKNNPYITIPELIKITGGGHTSITQARNNLKNKGYIERIGSNKNGYWNILK